MKELKYVLAVVLYMSLGAFIFKILELEREIEVRNDLRSYLDNFQRNHSISHELLEELIVRLTQATNGGISPLQNVTAEPNWTFGQAFFFVGTLITTVGYGHVTPLTASGKLFAIAYCVLGIPLMLCMLTALVNRLRICSIRFRGVLNERLSHLFAPLTIQLAHLLAVFIIFAVLLFVVPTLVLPTIETEWTHLDAAYYCFISLTTIGLGDYIPGDRLTQSHRAVYKVLVTAYLLMGLCGMMYFLALVNDLLNLRRFFIIEETHGGVDLERLKLAGRTKDGLPPKYDKQLDAKGEKQEPEHQGN